MACNWWGRRRAGGGLRIRLPIRSIAASPARAAISTAASSSSRKRGPKDARAKRLAIMDYDGANVQFLTDDSALVLAPRFSPDGDRVLYTSYESGFPRIYLLALDGMRRRALPTTEGTMSFAPRFSPDGRTVVYSLTQGGNTDLYTLDIASGQSTRRTTAPSIETAPSYSPDGRRIVFESDRSGSPQLYIMDARGGEARASASARGATARRSGRRAAI